MNSKNNQNEKTQIIHNDRKTELKSYQNNPHRSNTVKERLKNNITRKLETKKAFEKLLFY